MHCTLAMYKCYNRFNPRLIFPRNNCGRLWILQQGPSFAMEIHDYYHFIFLMKQQFVDFFKTEWHHAWFSLLNSGFDKK